MTIKLYESEMRRIVANYIMTRPQGLVQPRKLRRAIECLQLATAALVQLADTYERENKNVRV